MHSWSNIINYFHPPCSDFPSRSGLTNNREIAAISRYLQTKTYSFIFLSTRKNDSQRKPVQFKCVQHTLMRHNNHEQIQDNKEVFLGQQVENNINKSQYLNKVKKSTNIDTLVYCSFYFYQQQQLFQKKIPLLSVRTNECMYTNKQPVQDFRENRENEKTINC